MTSKLMGFEGQTHNTTMSTANSDDFGDDAAVNVSVNAQTLRYSNTQAMFGTMSLEFATDGPTTSFFDIADTAAADFSTRFYVYLTSYPTVTNAQFPVAGRSSASVQARMEMSTTGQIRMLCGGTSPYTTAVIPLNAWYRISVFGTGSGTASTNCTIRMYAGNGSSLVEEEVTSGTTSAQIDRFRYVKQGGTPSAAVSGFMDAIEQNVGSGTEIGPVNTLSPGWTQGFSVNIG